MNEEYSKLIERVRDIDEAAANYMFTEARKLKNFNPCGNLCGCFYWDETPQGVMFWGGIADELME